MKRYILPLVILFFSGSTFADTWYTPSCASGQGQLESRSGNRYHCERTTSRTPQCPNGYTKKVKPTGKDSCEKVTAEVKAPKCNLSAGQKQKNWKINVTSGPDYCTHKTKKKGQKPLKCGGSGFSISQNHQGNTDRCTKSGRVQKVDISCNSNETHKKSGADTCDTTTYNRPRF